MSKKVQKRLTMTRLQQLGKMFLSLSREDRIVLQAKFQHPLQGDCRPVAGSPQPHRMLVVLNMGMASMTTWLRR